MIAIAIAVQVVRIAVPYLFASMGGVFSERSGLIGLTLEGYMLFGAFCAATGSYGANSAWAGIGAALLGGAAMGMLYAVTALRFRADQVVVGVAINLLSIGLTRFFLRYAFGSSSNSPRVPGFGLAQSGSGFAALGTNPLIWLAFVSVIGSAWVLYRTPFGLRVRAVGDNPRAAASVGVPTARVRYGAQLVAGVLAALGGAYLALDQHQFSDQMTAGRGFIALAGTIFGRWDPGRAALACFLFAGAETLQIQLQGGHAVPSQLLDMLPYVLTIIALAGVVGRAVPPAALGRAEGGPA